MKIPKRSRGKPTADTNAKYKHDMIMFANALIEEQEKIDFKIGTRGWCYHLEGAGLITKGEFDTAVTAITALRKEKMIPIDFSAGDVKRKAHNIQKANRSIEDELDAWEYSMYEAARNYKPTILSDQTEIHIEVMVEKTDLVGLFMPICERYQLPITNIGGNADINSRVDAIRRCNEAQQDSKETVILYCGDHDPSGLQISSNLENNFKALEKGTGMDTGNIIIDVFGLTYDYIIENDLVWVENLDTGSSSKTKMGLENQRHPDHYKPYVQDYLAKYGARKVEANALLKDIPMARNLLEDNITKYIGEYALQEYKASLIGSRDELRKAFEKVWSAA